MTNLTSEWANTQSQLLADFGGVEREYRQEPPGKGTLSRLVAFEVTPSGKALLEAVAMVDE